MRNSVLLSTGQLFALMTVEISCWIWPSVTHPALGLAPRDEIAPLAAAAAESGQLTGSSGGRALVSVNDPSKVVLF
jgi:hypothetical protein